MKIVRSGIFETKSAARKTKHLDFDFEIKEVGENGSFTGYGSIFGVEDYGGDIVVKGAFLRSLAETAAKNRNLPILWQHNSAQPIGHYPVVKEDDKGLYLEGQLDLDIQEGRDALSRLKKRYVSGLSIGYASRKSDTDQVTGVRTLFDVDLFEVSLVTFPMNDNARIAAVKDRIERGIMPTTVKEYEKFLCEVGFSKSRSKVLANHGMGELIRREVGSTKQAEEVLEALKNFKLPTIN